ncbi:hypothetical protein Ppa06_62620 [Planomonospora parontospora subsp. parontospora]|uniref:Uncharacterized protein n=2 Tax=Planomonospora parontospora TaxID=58119 RepID=A0AA37BCU4_9ACTN|nr:hypothetical protein GCM10010126_06260 [Planomonospora parontospora]GII12464.1 hypothetical protein Ppa06_62620 [Planomonospora parontospora subsp. parontospora]
MARSHSATAAAKTGSAASRSRPIPAHCAPWPGKTHAVRCPRSDSSASPLQVPSGRSPRAKASSRAAASSRVPATTASRKSWWLRRTPAAAATRCSGASAETSRSR